MPGAVNGVRRHGHISIAVPLLMGTFPLKLVFVYAVQYCDQSFRFCYVRFIKKRSVARRNVCYPIFITYQIFYDSCYCWPAQFWSQWCFSCNHILWNCVFYLEIIWLFDWLEINTKDDCCRAETPRIKRSITKINQHWNHLLALRSRKQTKLFSFDQLLIGTNFGSN